MRRLDWFLAAVVATFLIGALLVEASAASLGGWGLGHAPTLGGGEVSVRRLVSHLPRPLMLPGDAR